MKSIIQDDTSFCFLCGGNKKLESLDKHHIYGGAMRNKSEQYGLFVYLHHCKCHIFGNNSVHGNPKTGKALRAYAQKIAMEKYGWSKEDFISIFGRSYI